VAGKTNKAVVALLLFRALAAHHRTKEDVSVLSRCVDRRYATCRNPYLLRDNYKKNPTPNSSKESI
jgi:hypothetical protein